MKVVTIPYPEGLPQTLKLSDSEFSEEVRFLAAAKLFELGKISSGKASKIAENGVRLALLHYYRNGVTH